MFHIYPHPPTCRLLAGALNQPFSKATLQLKYVQTAIIPSKVRYYSLGSKILTVGLSPAATKWIKSWQRNGWKTANGGDVKNKADIERLSNLCRRIDVTWV